ncbi:MAG: hypothetical protein OXC42_06955 [Gammaproteobacteria bacterium]|nr:hypothetical protein [Gammaproteobacteria bacterium]
MASDNGHALSNQPLIDARDIGVRHGERWVVRHVDIKVIRGELVYVIGVKGAG